MTPVTRSMTRSRLFGLTSVDTSSDTAAAGSLDDDTSDAKSGPSGSTMFEISIKDENEIVTEKKGHEIKDENGTGTEKQGHNRCFLKITEKKDFDNITRTIATTTFFSKEYLSNESVYFSELIYTETKETETKETEGIIFEQVAFTKSTLENLIKYLRNVEDIGRHEDNGSLFRSHAPLDPPPYIHAKENIKAQAMLAGAGCNPALAEFITTIGNQKSECKDKTEDKSEEKDLKIQKVTAGNSRHTGKKRSLDDGDKSATGSNKTSDSVISGFRVRKGLLELLKAANYFGMARLVELASACLACYFNLYMPLKTKKEKGGAEGGVEGGAEGGAEDCEDLEFYVPLSTSKGIGMVLGQWLTQPALEAIKSHNELNELKQSLSEVVLEFMYQTIHNQGELDGELDKFRNKSILVEPDKDETLNFAGKVHLRRLKFGDNFNMEVKGLSELTSLKELRFGSHCIFDQKLGDLSKLKNLRVLEFGEKFNQEVPGLSKLTSLEELRFGYKFDQELEDLSNLKNMRVLEFSSGSQFNQKVPGLSKLTSLEELRFGFRFDQELDNLSKLKNLRFLEFGFFFC